MLIEVPFEQIALIQIGAAHTAWADGHVDVEYDDDGLWEIIPGSLVIQLFDPVTKKWSEANPQDAALEALILTRLRADAGWCEYCKRRVNVALASEDYDAEAEHYDLKRDMEVMH